MYVSMYVRIRRQKKKDNTEGRMTGDGGGKILFSVLIEDYEIMRTNLCPSLSLYNGDQTAEFETFNLIIDERIFPKFQTSKQPHDR